MRQPILTKLQLILVCVLACVLPMLIIACDSAPNPITVVPTPSYPPPVATPTVDLDHARAALKSDCALTYEEILALRDDSVFVVDFSKCRLKDTTGWVMGWLSDRDKNYDPIPDKNHLLIALYNPFYGFGKDLEGYAEIGATYVTDEEIAQLKYGQRISFSGGITDITVKGGHPNIVNVQYSKLDDDPPVPAPTADELKDLTITIDRRGGCFGDCPNYSFTIDPNGIVTFEGDVYTEAKGTVTSTITIEQLVELAGEVKKAGFFGLNVKYEARVTDAPTNTLTVRMGGQSKTVESSGGNVRRLDILWNRVNQIVNSAQWIGTR